MPNTMIQSTPAFSEDISKPKPRLILGRPNVRPKRCLTKEEIYKLFGAPVIIKKLKNIPPEAYLPRIENSNLVEKPKPVKSSKHVVKPKPVEKQKRVEKAEPLLKPVVQVGPKTQFRLTPCPNAIQEIKSADKDPTNIKNKCPEFVRKKKPNSIFDRAEDKDAEAFIHWLQEQAGKTVGQKRSDKLVSGTASSSSSMKSPVLPDDILLDGSCSVPGETQQVVSTVGETTSATSETLTPITSPPRHGLVSSPQTSPDAAAPRNRTPRRNNRRPIRLTWTYTLLVPILLSAIMFKLKFRQN